jgi:bacterioferritin (cytochrome b1)
MTKKKTPESPMGNRTGTMIAPELARELVEGAVQFSPEPNLDTSEAAKIRAQYVAEGKPIGSLPTAEDMGQAVLMDKLGARLAFERSGVRLYEALIQKRIAIRGASKPTVEDLQHIRDEELEHMHALEECILDLGGDPTVVTPAADISATLSSGALKVVIDPRTTISQCLEAILTAELVDNDCWGVLVKLMEIEGMDDELATFQEALVEEQEHLQKVRSWILADAAPEAA